MTVLETVLRKLEANCGEFVSGEEIADGMSVTRNAIWKAVRQLRKQGYEIDSVTNRGYRLSADHNVLSSETVAKYLGESAGRYNILVLDKIGSTNDDLKKLADGGAKEGTVLIANEQTNGKGRQGHTFYSPNGGLYMSFLLRPQLGKKDSQMITVAAAVAVAEAIREISGARTSVKWVNDIYVGKKKVCGILSEAPYDAKKKQLKYAIVGIGINVETPANGFPEELRPIAGSLFGRGKCLPNVRAKLAARILECFSYYYDNLDRRDYIGTYRALSNLTGKKVEILSADERTASGTVVGIDEDAQLLVRLTNGKVTTFSSGEARVIKW